jgi:hypothetical protein
MSALISAALSSVSCLIFAKISLLRPFPCLPRQKAFAEIFFAFVHSASEFISKVSSSF